MAVLTGIIRRLFDLSLTKVLVVVLVLMQFPLWFGSGGWIRVWLLERDVAVKEEENLARQQRIRELEAEVQDLKKNPRAADERARYELGLIAPGERFLQWGPPNSPKPGTPNGQSLSPPQKKGVQP